MKVRIVADHIISPLGAGTGVQFDAIMRGDAAIREIDDSRLWPEPFYGAAFSDAQREAFEQMGQANHLTLLEAAMVTAIRQVADQASMDLRDPGTALILASTKGNIDALAKEAGHPAESLLHRMPERLASHFNLPKTPLLVSNACISGLLAVIVAARMLHAGQYKRAVVCGGDLLTRFTLSGFQSFKAVSKDPCRPFDARRDGITLGEAVGALAMEHSAEQSAPYFMAGASANDANHISGPSRTGEGLYQALLRTLPPDQLKPDMIVAHGTATMFNDEMECQAFNRAGLNDVPLNSLKGVFGHTLGAAGIVELIVGLQAMKSGTLLPTLGYGKHGVSLPLNVTPRPEKASISRLLKTSSGFGGCNGAALFGI